FAPDGSVPVRLSRAAARRCCRSRRGCGVRCPGLRDVGARHHPFRGRKMMRASLFVQRFVPVCSALACSAFLCACGPDAMTAGASGAAAEAAAARQAKEQKSQLEAQIKATQESEQKRVDRISEQVDGASR